MKKRSCIAAHAIHVQYYLFVIALLWARCDHIRHPDVCPDDVVVRLLCAAADDVDWLQRLQWVCENPGVNLAWSL